MTESALRGIIGLVGGCAVTILGGYDSILKGLLLFMLLDILLGLICAAFFDTSKYSNNGVSSTALLKGAFRKISVLALVCISVVIDKLLGIEYVRNAMCMYLIASEGISILEHLTKMDVPFPAFITAILEQIKDNSEDGTK